MAAAYDWEVPFTGAFVFIAGLNIGIAGWIRPLFCPAADAGASLTAEGAGGASAAATLGFDSVGGGGPFCAIWVLDVVELGSLTVAAGFSIAAGR